MASTPDPVAVAQDMWQAVYARDWPRLRGFFTDESIYYDVPTGPTTAARGPDGILARLRLGLDELAGYDHHPGSVASQGDTVMIEHAETWTWRSGETVTLPFVTVHRIRADKVLLWKDYWDYETLRRGAPPDWEARLLAADVSGWVYDATGVA